MILASAGEGIFGLDLEGNTTFINPAALELTGYQSRELLGHNMHEIIHYQKADGTPFPAIECPMNRTIKDGEVQRIRDGLFWTKEGKPLPVEYVTTPILENGRLVGAVGVFRDITERKRYEEKLEYFAIHDALTGLLNRRSLEDMLTRTSARAKRGVMSSLLFMDLDNFKYVNDTIGHSAGDEVLITLSGLLKAELRTEDVVFRLGGDEFAVLLDGIGGKEALFAAERLRSAIEAHPFKLEGRVFPLSLSIGLIEIDGTIKMGELMSQADAAMYQAKDAGRNRVVAAEGNS